MRLPMYLATTLVLMFCVAINLAFWGGIASSSSMAPVLREPLRLQAPLAYTWLLAGEAIAGPLGMGSALADFAESHIDQPDYVLAEQALAVDRLMAARSTWLKPLHPAPLLLAPLALFLWWRRPRGLKTFGGRR